MAYNPTDDCEPMGMKCGVDFEKWAEGMESPTFMGDGKKYVPVIRFCPLHASAPDSFARLTQVEAERDALAKEMDRSERGVMLRAKDATLLRYQEALEGLLPVLDAAIAYGDHAFLGPDGVVDPHGNLTGAVQEYLQGDGEQVLGHDWGHVRRTLQTQEER